MKIDEAKGILKQYTQHGLMPLHSVLREAVQTALDRIEDQHRALTEAFDDAITREHDRVNAKHGLR